MNGERREVVARRLEGFRADADRYDDAQQLGSTAYAYPQSLGEWLGTAVQIAGSVSWQAPYALRPLEGQTSHEQRIAQQGREFVALYGAVLVGTLAACDAELEREGLADPQLELPDPDSVIDVWDEARDERNGLTFSLGALGEAIWIYGTCRDRSAALLPTDGRPKAPPGSRLRSALPRRRRRAVSLRSLLAAPLTETRGAGGRHHTPARG